MEKSPQRLGKTPIDLMMIGLCGRVEEYETKCPYESLPEEGCRAHNFLISAMYKEGEEDFMTRIERHCKDIVQDGIHYNFDSIGQDDDQKKLNLLADATKLLCEVCKKEYAANHR